MKSISKTFNKLKINRSNECNPKPGFKNSCQQCAGCKKRRIIFDDDEPVPVIGNYELREDGGIELREDGSFELREINN